MSAEEALRRVEAHASAAQSELATRADAGEDVLHYLAEHGASATRRAVAANPGASPKSNRLLSEDRELEVRAALARKIGRLLPGLLEYEREHLRALSLATLERLARDQEPQVRAILSEEIKRLDCVPRDVVLLLARDVETIVSTPIIECSPLLSDDDLLQIVAGAEAREAIAAVARRSQLSERVADGIADTLDIPAVAALLANTQACLRKSTLDRIVVRAVHVSEWHGPLVLRPELTPDLIVRIATFVGTALVEALARRRGLDEATRRQLLHRLEDRLPAEGPQNAAPAPDPRNEVEAALGAGKLDDAFIEAAAMSGQKETIVLALASLAPANAASVRAILASGSAKAITALVWRAKLSMRTSFKIQTLVMRLKAPDILPARGGLHFPLSEDEMRWQLKFFDIRG